MFPLIGGLISGGMNLLGGLMGQSNQASINQQNVQAQEAINAQNIAATAEQNQANRVWQSEINTQNLANASQVNQENANLAETFAQNGIQWRVADARKAGISPLAALGSSFSPSAPVMVGSTSQAGSPGVAANLVAPRVDASNSFGSGIANFGQDISRAIAATRSPEEQAVAIEKTRQDLESGQLDNQLKRAQLASTLTRLHSAQIGPGLPKVHAEMQAVRMPDGSIQPFPSRDVEGAPWIDEMAKLQWMWRNQIEPAFGYNIPKEVGPAAPGKYWARDPLSGRYNQWPRMWDVIKGLYGRVSSPGLSASP